VIRAPGLTPLFLVGDDDRSRAWLRQRRRAAAARRGPGGQRGDARGTGRAAPPRAGLSPASGDDLAQRLGLKHYPVLITATGIEP
jgi:hypothetical protein